MYLLKVYFKPIIPFFLIYLQIVKSTSHLIFQMIYRLCNSQIIEFFEWLTDCVICKSLEVTSLLLWICKLLRFSNYLRIIESVTHEFLILLTHCTIRKYISVRDSIIRNSCSKRNEIYVFLLMSKIEILKIMELQEEAILFEVICFTSF